MRIKTYSPLRVWNNQDRAYENVGVIDTRAEGLSTLKEAFYYNPALRGRKHSPAWSLGFIYGLRISRLDRKVKEAEAFMDKVKKMGEMFGEPFVKRYFGQTIAEIEDSAWETKQDSYQFANTLQTAMNLNLSGQARDDFFQGLAASENVPM